MTFRQLGPVVFVQSRPRTASRMLVVLVVAEVVDGQLWNLNSFRLSNAWLQVFPICIEPIHDGGPRLGPIVLVVTEVVDGSVLHGR